MKFMKSFLSCLIVLLAVAACGDKAAAPPPALRVVKAITVSAAGDNVARSFGGDVRARFETIAGFRVGGKIAERLVEAGTAVKAGQVLARLDPSDLALTSTQAEAQAALAAADAKRFRDLREKNFVSQAAVDARDTAQKAATAQAALARNQAAYANLNADRAGVVAEVLAQAGQVVAPGQGVFRLAWDGEREIAISLPEEAIGDIKVGSAADVSLWSAKDKTIRGRVRELSPMADPATRTYAARVSIIDHIDLPLGMSATVSFKLQRAPALRVPLTAVFQQGDQPAVWVIGSDNKVSLRKVTVSSFGDGGASVVAGLNAGERVVAAGVNRLQAGETVVIAVSKP